MLYRVESNSVIVIRAVKKSHQLSLEDFFFSKIKSRKHGELAKRHTPGPKGSYYSRPSHSFPRPRPARIFQFQSHVGGPQNFARLDPSRFGRIRREEGRHAQDPLLQCLGDMGTRKDSFNKINQKLFWERNSSFYYFFVRRMIV